MDSWRRMGMGGLGEEILFRRYARSGGQVLCAGHDVWWLPASGCPLCRAVV
jgi:hypothetical protein